MEKNANFVATEPVIYLEGKDIDTVFGYPCVVTDFCKRHLVMQQKFDTNHTHRLHDGMDTVTNGRIFFEADSFLKFAAYNRLEITKEAAELLKLSVR